MTDRTAATVDLDTRVCDSSDPRVDRSGLGYSTATERRSRSTRPRGGLVVVAVVVIAVAALVGVARSTLSARGSDGRIRSELADMAARYDAALIERDWEALERLLAPDLAFHNVDLGLVQDRAGFFAWARIIGESYPDFAVDIDDVRLEGEVATVRFHEDKDGADDVERSRTPSSVAITGVVIFRVVDERIVELWSNYDEFGLLHQRAALPDTRR